MNYFYCFLLLIFTCSKEAVCQSGDAEGSCQRAINIFPAKLKDLRTTFQKVRDYFQLKDDELDIILLENSLLQDFKSSIGCQTVTEMIRFYLEDVLPHAQEGSIVIERNVNFMKDKLLDLKQTMKRCQHFLPCDRKSKAIKQIKEKYNKLKNQGVYKAVGEFDIFINYIEEYLISKKK